MPTLNWIGKEAVVKHHKDVPLRLLEPVPELSCGAADAGTEGGTPHNLIVQGDNLHALKALLPRYAGKVKCIYIDPPYNTGNEGWAYNDNVNSPEIRKWLGEVVGKEGETLDRHDRWLCMMYPRLVLLKQFLREDGILFISIDDNEVHNLRSLVEEVGGLNFVGCIVWERKRKGSHLSKKLTKKTEYILAYSQRGEDIELVGEDVGVDEDFPLVKRTNGIKDLHIPSDKMGPTRLPDGVYAQGRYGRGGTAVELLSDFSVYGGAFVTDVHIRGPFVWTQENLDRELASGGRCFLRTRNMSLRAVKGIDNQGQKGLSSLLTKDVGTNEDASSELAAILSADLNTVFQYSKPSSLVKTLIRAATYFNKDAIILDSFSGSGTTGHAVLKQNAEDGGNRRFILVEMDDNIARTVTAERVRRVATGYTKGALSPSSSPATGRGEKVVAGLGGGFQFCRLSAEPLFDADGQIRADVRFAQLAEFVWFAETGTGYTGQADSPLIGVHEGRAIYLLYNGILKDRSVAGGNVLTGPVFDLLPRFAGPKVIYAAANRMGGRAAREGITFKQTPYALEV
ncbi:site-specific DNA-methyltransferase [Immundisolibacter cernigliae]|uniref:site-specific DNA-methyltransferase (adenine-specific) n=1 Tax=Immundisolibacter cernigliae TaxID=1810504 RepID=A0A1B1YWX4_9GAMM|nr:site-specific DNA-methyltransferase [Immundisolibacter cernigliae]ANX05216.1 DNA methyltransferase [Immundisolibacter cernigliae]